MFDDRVGDEAAQQHVDRRRIRAGRQLEAPAGRRGVDPQPELVGGVHHGVGGRVGDARVEGDLDGGISVVGHAPRAGLQQRIGEERPEIGELVVVEVAVDEHDVGDVDGPAERQPECGRSRGDGGGPGIGVDGAHREPVRRTGPGHHWPDPRHQAPRQPRH